MGKIDKMPPLSSRMVKSKSIPLLFKKVNSERNPRKKEIIKSSLINYDSPKYHNNNNFNRKLSSSSTIDSKKIKIIDSKEFHENIYQDMTLINAPSFNNNVSEIRQMIKEKKYENFKKIYNMFFSSPFPNEYMNDFILLKKKKLLSPNKKNILIPIKRNRSCEELIISKKRIKSVMKNEDLTTRLSTNHSKILNTNLTNKPSNIINTQRSRKQLKYNISDLSTSTNKSLINHKLQENQSVSNININERSDTTFQNNIVLPKLPTSNEQNSIPTELINSVPGIQETVGSFLTELNTNKMKFNINQLIIGKSKTKEKLDEYEEKILKLKIFQKYQKERLEIILNDSEFNIQERIDYIIKMFKIYERIYNEYMYNLGRYNAFLFNISNELEIELRTINKKKKDINYDLDKLMGNLIDKQNKFEYLIKTRNFLFSVKNRGKNIIKLNNQYIYRISKRKNLMEKLFDLFGREFDSLAFKHLKKLIPIEQLEKFIKIKPAKGRLMIRLAHTIRNTLKLDEKEKGLLIPPPPGEKIFQKPEEFIKILDNMTNNNLDLMHDYEKVELEKNGLIDELNQDIALFEKFEKSDTNEYLIKDKKYLQEEKQKYVKLSKKYKDVCDLFAKKKELSSLKLDFKIFSFKAFNNIYYYNIVKYNKLRIKYKFEGLVLLEKLINNINHIMTINKESQIFDPEDIFHYVSQRILFQILDTKIDYFNNNNQYLIKEYSLKLLKLYEFFAEFIMNKNIERKKLNSEIYNKERDKVINERKVYNAKVIKKMFIEKRDNSIKELMDKWNKKTVRNSRNTDIEIIQNLDKNEVNKNIKENINKCDDEFGENNLFYEDEF